MKVAADGLSPRLEVIFLGVVSPPLLAILFFLIEWGAAWFILGHIPQPMINDPKSISPVSGVLHSLTGLALFGMFPLCLIGVSAAYRRWGGSLKVIAMAGLGIFMCLGTFAVLGSFPWDAMGWWLD